jgi:hypothetical protein
VCLWLLQLSAFQYTNRTISGKQRSCNLGSSCTPQFEPKLHTCRYHLCICHCIRTPPQSIAFHQPLSRSTFQKELSPSQSPSMHPDNIDSPPVLSHPPSLTPSIRHPASVLYIATVSRTLKSTLSHALQHQQLKRRPTTYQAQI